SFSVQHRIPTRFISQINAHDLFRDSTNRRARYLRHPPLARPPMPGLIQTSLRNAILLHGRFLSGTSSASLWELNASREEPAFSFHLSGRFRFYAQVSTPDAEPRS